MSLQVVLNAEVGGSDIGSDGWAGIMVLKNKNSDAVRSVYAKFKTVRLQVCGVCTSTPTMLHAARCNDLMPV